jgi:hypothetical protein
MDRNQKRAKQTDQARQMYEAMWRTKHNTLSKETSQSISAIKGKRKL